MAAPRERLIHVLSRIRDLGERSLFFVPAPDRPQAENDAVVARTAAASAAVPAVDEVVARGQAGAVLDENPVEARWRDAEARVRTCTRCRLCETRTNAVFGSGTRQTRLFVIGEGPGHHEDLQAEAFVGPAGKLLTKILHAVGFERDAVFITNVVKCRPPANRAPLPDEVAACAGYLEEQLEMVRPAAILLLGASAARAVLGTTASIGSLRKVVHRLGDVPVLVTYHPAALLRNPDYKRPTWEDVQLLRRVHDERVAADA